MEADRAREILDSTAFGNYIFISVMGRLNGFNCEICEHLKKDYSCKKCLEKRSFKMSKKFKKEINDKIWEAFTTASCDSPETGINEIDRCIAEENRLRELTHNVYCKSLERLY